MARSILDIMKDDIRKRETVAAAPETLSIGDLLRAGATGKQLGSRGPQAESTAARMAAFQGQQALDQGSAEGALAAQAIAGAEDTQTQQVSQARESNQLRREDVAQRMRESENQLLGNFERNIKQLNTQQGLADLEQLGIMIRLNNQKYIEQLQNLGATKRLDSEAAFKIEAHKAAFQDAEELLGLKLDWESIVNADQREFDEWLKKSSIQWDVNQAAKKAKEASQAGLFGAAGGMAGAAAGAEREAPTPYSPSSNASSTGFGSTTGSRMTNEGVQ